MDSASSSSYVVPPQNGNNDNNNNNPGAENQFRLAYENWMVQQEEDLEELNRVLASGSGPENEVNLRAVAQRVMDHFQEYLDIRAQQASCNSPYLLSPSWCSTLERSIMWMGGCRATMNIRLVYSMCGLETEVSMMEYLRGGMAGNMADLSAHQLGLINTLHSKVIKEEDRLSSQMATLQENMAGEPFLGLAMSWSGVGFFNVDVEKAIENHTGEMGDLLKEADILRMDTLKEMLKILTPYQGVYLLATSKKLHLTLSEWSRTRDQLLANT